MNYNLKSIRITKKREAGNNQSTDITKDKKYMYQIKQNNENVQKKNDHKNKTDNKKIFQNHKQTKRKR